MEDSYSQGMIVEGKISGVQPYGAFVSLGDSHHGMIHISEISDRFVRNITDFVRLGEIIRVKIIGYDQSKNFFRLSLKQIVDRERQIIRKPPRLRQQIRQHLNISEDFTPLAEMLPRWIEDALKKGDTADD